MSDLRVAGFLWRHRSIVFWSHLAPAGLPAAVAALLTPALTKSAWFWAAVAALVLYRALAWLAAWTRPHGLPAPLWPLRRALLRPGMPVAAMVDGRVEVGHYAAQGLPGYHEIDLELSGTRVMLPEAELYPLPGRRPRHAGHSLSLHSEAWWHDET